MSKNKNSNKVKNVPASTISRLYKNLEWGHSSLSFGVDDDIIEFIVKTHLSISEMLNVVNNVYYSVTEGVDGTYHPELFDYFLRYEVVESYTNIKLPDDIDTCYNLLYGTDLYNGIINGCRDFSSNGEPNAKPLINQEQFKKMVESIEWKFNMFALSKTQKESKLDVLLDTIINAVDGFKDDLSGVDIKKTLDNLSNMKNIDSDGIVQAFLDKKYDPEVTMKMAEAATNERSEDNVVNFSSDR